jgi:hypothetical protein
MSRAAGTLARRALPLLPLCALLVAPRAAASCYEPRAVTTSTLGATSYVYTPGQPFKPKAVQGATPLGGTATYYMRGLFWAFGGGDPRIGSGIDCGRFEGLGWDAVAPEEWDKQATNWVKPMYFPEKAFFGGPYGHWQFPGVDGCISELGSDPIKADDDECLVVMLSDFSEPQGHFAILSTPPSAGDFFFTERQGFPKRIELASVPVPKIKGSRREGGKLKLDVSVDRPAGGEFGKNGIYLRCHASEILKGYRLYARRFPSTAKPPTGLGSRAIDIRRVPKLSKRPPWEELTAQPVALGKSAQVSIACSPGEDVVLAATLTFGGSAAGAADFELIYASADSERVSCSGTPSTKKAP